MSKANLASETRGVTWDFYGTDREESWMRTVIEYTLHPWKYAFGFRN